MAMLRGDWEVSGNVGLFQLGRSSDKAHMSLELITTFYITFGAPGCNIEILALKNLVKK